MSYAVNAVNAQAMLMRKGVTIVMTRRNTAAHDPVAQESSGVGTVEQPIRVVILPGSVTRGMSFEERAHVRARRRHLIIGPKDPTDGAALAFEPETGHTVEFEGSTWTLQGVSCIKPDGETPIVFEAEATR